MKCSQIHQDICFDISNKEFENHLAECTACNELYAKVNDAMSLLDHSEDVPEGLLESILMKKGEREYVKTKKLNLSGYFQLAAAIIFGVFIGHMFGKNANATVISQKNKPIVEYYESHHLNNDYSEFDIHFLWL